MNPSVHKHGTAAKFNEPIRLEVEGCSGRTGSTHLKVVEVIIQQDCGVGDAFLGPDKHEWHHALWERVRDESSGRHK